MLHNGFAQLSQFTRKTESYNFKSHFYLHCGSVLVGSNTNVVIKGQLSINGRPAKLDILKNIKVVLTTYNYIDNLPVTKTYNGLAFNSDKELVLTFQVPPNLNRIEVILKCDVVNATTKQIEKFKDSHEFKVHANDIAKNMHMAMPYLRVIDGEYECVFLGRNGEPASKKKA